MLWPTSCSTKMRTINHHEVPHSFDANKLKITASTVVFRPVGEISGGPLPFPLPHGPSVVPLLPPSSHSTYIRYPTPTQNAGNGLLTLLGLQMSLGTHDHLLSSGRRTL
ncbi:hypothetical protein EVAR_68133_1 [Eumeta japonica]|uniref:Uncharacterized protein n=1 Tax=Eumeta variegata TaxID=151549 RepID=A0A4C2AG00_EUMVA|nr:hypothetical protein EVAR_68133_1 [Eumeta japonica]